MDNTISLTHRAGAEALAAFALVFAGCGAAVANARYDGALGAVGVSLVFGLIIMAMIYATGHLSGAHINPAVTIAFTVALVSSLLVRWWLIQRQMRHVFLHRDAVPTPFAQTVDLDAHRKAADYTIIAPASRSSAV